MTYASRRRSQRWIVRVTATRYFLEFTETSNSYDHHFRWLKFDWQHHRQRFCIKSGYRLKQLNIFAAALAETKKFCFTFVSVLFQFYFNCADSLRTAAASLPRIWSLLESPGSRATPKTLRSWRQPRRSALSSIRRHSTECWTGCSAARSQWTKNEDRSDAGRGFCLDSRTSALRRATDASAAGETSPSLADRRFRRRPASSSRRTARRRPSLGRRGRRSTGRRSAALERCWHDCPPACGSWRCAGNVAGSRGEPATGWRWRPTLGEVRVLSSSVWRRRRCRFAAAARPSAWCSAIPAERCNPSRRRRQRCGRCRGRNPWCVKSWRSSRASGYSTNNNNSTLLIVVRPQQKHTSSNKQIG